VWWCSSSRASRDIDDSSRRWRRVKRGVRECRERTSSCRGHPVNGRRVFRAVRTSLVPVWVYHEVAYRVTRATGTPTRERDRCVRLFHHSYHDHHALPLQIDEHAHPSGQRTMRSSYVATVGVEENVGASGHNNTKRRRRGYVYDSSVNVRQRCQPTHPSFLTASASSSLPRTTKPKFRLGSNHFTTASKPLMLPFPINVPCQTVLLVSYFHAHFLRHRSK